MKPLKRETDILPDNDAALKQVAARYAVSITPEVREAIRTPGDPVARQYVPDVAELVVLPEDRADPIGDDVYSPVPGIVHRHPDRVLLMPVNVCAVYCRFCFRREKVGPGRKVLTPAELARALDYIRADKNIWEVILTGGDPLILSPRKLGALLRELESIDHVQVLRLHTRIPVADPRRVTKALCGALKTRKALYVAIHVNHAQEIIPAAEEAFARLRAADCVLLSQSVLLKNVNDSVKALEELFRRLVALRVKPYYLHHPDLARGTGHFRLSLTEGQNLVKKLRTRLSGLGLPAYVLDIPGGHGKVPVGPAHLHLRGEDVFVEDMKGALHAYPPPPDKERRS